MPNIWKITKGRNSEIISEDEQLNKKTKNRLTRSVDNAGKYDGTGEIAGNSFNYPAQPLVEGGTSVGARIQFWPLQVIKSIQSFFHSDVPRSLIMPEAEDADSLTPTWGEFLAEKWIGYKSSVFSAGIISQYAQSKTIVDDFMDMVEENADLSDMTPVISGIFENGALYSEVIRVVGKKLKAGDLEGVLKELFTRLIEQNKGEMLQKVESKKVFKFLDMCLMDVVGIHDELLARQEEWLMQQKRNNVSQQEFTCGNDLESSGHCLHPGLLFNQGNSPTIFANASLLLTHFSATN